MSQCRDTASRQRDLNPCIQLIHFIPVPQELQEVKYLWIAASTGSAHLFAPLLRLNVLGIGEGVL